MDGSGGSGDESDFTEKSGDRLRTAARVAEVDGYAGALATAAEQAPFRESHLQRRLTGEVEEVKQQLLQSRLDALPVDDRRRESFRAVKNSKSAAAWVTTWPSVDNRLSNEVLSVWSAWYLGEPPCLLTPLLGRQLTKDGQVRGVVDEHGVSVCCARLDGAWKHAHDAVKLQLAREAKAAGFVVEVEVFGAFTRALREADVRRVEEFSRTRKSELQGVIPDLLLDAGYYELKGIRRDGSRSNYSGAAVTGVEKRAVAWQLELQKKVERLDEKIFHVQGPAAGPFQRRLQEIGGVKPLVFGQFGELSDGLEVLLDDIAARGADQAAARYLLREGPGAVAVQKRLLRQRVACCVARAQAGVLLQRLKFALPGWASAEGRRREEAEQEARQRAEQARAFSGERHSEEGDFFFVAAAAAS